MVFVADVDVDVNPARKGVCPEIVTAYERLAYEIVLTACRDYRRVLIKLKRNVTDVDAKIEKESLEQFFCSEWFGILSKADPQELMRRLQEEVAKGCRR